MTTPRVGRGRLTSAELAHLARALSSALTGGVVQDVRSREAELVELIVRGEDANWDVGFSLTPGAAGPLLLPELPRRRAGSPEGRELAMVLELRARVVGAVVASVAAVPGERVLRIELRRGEELQVLLARFHGSAPSLELSTEEVALAPTSDDGAADGATSPTLEAWSVALLEGRRVIVTERRLEAVAQRVRRARGAAASLVSKREADCARVENPAGFRRQADALAAHLHEVARGASEFVVSEWEGQAPDEPLRITLDPALGAGENLRRAYARAAKAERGLAESQSRLAQARASLELLEALEERVESLRERHASPTGLDAVALQELDAVERSAREMLPTRRTGGRAPAAEVALPYRRYVSIEGMDILVGRSASGNDALTFRVARGNDVWLHARESPGPHVVIRLPRGAEVPTETLLDAATLAHALGQRGKDGSGDVTWCRVKDVSKRKGMAPGQVLVARDKTLHLRLDPERLARLKATLES